MSALLTPSGAASAQFARLDGIVTLVDAKHIEQHLDEEKPEGAENEAVEQVAFADRLLLNKCDLASGEEELQRVMDYLHGQGVKLGEGLGDEAEGS